MFFLPLTHRRLLVKSEVSIFRGLAFVSLSVASLFIAYKFGKDHHQTASLNRPTHPNEINFALCEGQTILGVKDTSKTMWFYFSNNGEEQEEYE